MIFTVGFLQLYCKIRFSDFALVGLLGGKQLIFYELLGYCGAALHGIAGGVKNERTYKALEVDAYMTQQQSQGAVVPDSFTHGSSEQRVRWLTTGFQSGQIQACNTFRASQL